MRVLIRSRLRRTAALSVMFGLLITGTGATTALAATNSSLFTANFDEVTTVRTCPPGTPPRSFCFTGTGSGPVSPGEQNGKETFAGFVDPATASAVNPCPVDRNAVSIRTTRGTLFLTTKGHNCGIGVPDNGTWQAVGGTGSFERASGSGTVSTTGSAFTSMGTITSHSAYLGTLTRGGD